VYWHEHERHAFVYVLNAPRTGLVKIGTSLDPAGRAKQVSREIRSPAVLAAESPGSFTLEKALHRLLAKDQVLGEWFVRTPRIDRVIAILRRGALRPRHLTIFPASPVNEQSQD
jgi:hypothetical protein